MASGFHPGIILLLSTCCLSVAAEGLSKIPLSNGKEFSCDELMPTPDPTTTKDFFGFECPSSTPKCWADLSKRGCARAVRNTAVCEKPRARSYRVSRHVSGHMLMNIHVHTCAWGCAWTRLSAYASTCEYPDVRGRPSQRGYMHGGRMHSLPEGVHATALVQSDCFCLLCLVAMCGCTGICGRLHAWICA